MYIGRYSTNNFSTFIRNRLPNEEMPLLTRQLIVTEITRAKEQVNILASEDVGVKAEVVKATRIDQQL